MIEICFIMPFHIFEGRGGGAEVQTWLLAKELAKRGYRVTYIAESVHGKAGTMEQSEGVNINWLKHYRHFRWRNVFAYYQAIKQVNPDLLVQRMSSYVTGVIGFYAKRHHKPFAWICTDNSLPVKWIFSKKQRADSQTKSHKFIKKSVLWIDALIHDISRQYGMRFITHPFTQNEEQDQQLRKHYGMDSFRMNSGHESPEKKASSKARFDNKIVLWVATMGPRKQPWKFVDLARQCQDNNWHFVMVGGHSDQQYLNSFLKDVPDNLHCTGRLPYEEALAWFHKATVFVNTSTAEGEGFPNTFIQAWLRGVPVVSLAVDPDNIIKNNKLGYVAHGDLKQMKIGLESFLTNEDIYNHHSEKVAAFARDSYAIDKVADAFLEIVGLETQMSSINVSHEENDVINKGVKVRNCISN